MAGTLVINPGAEFLTFAREKSGRQLHLNSAGKITAHLWRYDDVTYHTLEGRLWESTANSPWTEAWSEISSSYRPTQYGSSGWGHSVSTYGGYTYYLSLNRPTVDDYTLAGSELRCSVGTSKAAITVTSNVDLDVGIIGSSLLNAIPHIIATSYGVIWFGQTNQERVMGSDYERCQYARYALQDAWSSTPLKAMGEVATTSQAGQQIAFLAKGMIVDGNYVFFIYGRGSATTIYVSSRNLASSDAVVQNQATLDAGTTTHSDFRSYFVSHTVSSTEIYCTYYAGSASDGPMMKLSHNGSGTLSVTSISNQASNLGSSHVQLWWYDTAAATLRRYAAEVSGTTLTIYTQSWNGTAWSSSSTLLTESDARSQSSNPNAVWQALGVVESGGTTYLLYMWMSNTTTYQYYLGSYVLAAGAKSDPAIRSFPRRVFNF